MIEYQLVQVIRTRLRQTGGYASWAALRRGLEGQQRVTATFKIDRRADPARTQGHPRRTVAAGHLCPFGIEPDPGGTRTHIV